MTDTPSTEDVGPMMYGWRNESGVAYIGTPESVKRWAASKTSGIVALVPLAEWDATTEKLAEAERGIVEADDLFREGEALIRDLQYRLGAAEAENKRLRTVITAFVGPDRNWRFADGGEVDVEEGTFIVSGVCSVAPPQEAEDG